MDPVDKVVEALKDDYDRQGLLRRTDVERLLDKRALSPQESLVVYERLAASGIQIEESVLDSEFATDLHEEDAAIIGDSFGVLRATPLLTAEEEIELGRRIALARDALEPSLKEEAEETSQFVLQLDAKIQSIVDRGQRAKDRLITSNIRLVISIAKRYQSTSSLDLADLIQEGILGLMRAVDRFDYTLGFKFSTYATWWIRQSITRAIADKNQLVRYPVHIIESIARIKKASRILTRKYGREPNVRQIADELDLPPDRVEFLRQLNAMTDVSLDQPVYEEGNARMEEFVPSNEPGVVEVVSYAQVVEMIDEVLECLPERDATIIKKRFGLVDGNELTLEEVGKIFDVTRERIRQIQKKAMGRMQRILRQKYEDMGGLE